MQINRKAMLKSLSFLKSGLLEKPTAEYCQKLLFKNGIVRTYNDEISIAAKTSLDLDGAISAKEFIALLKSYDDDKLEINQEDNAITINGKKIKSGIVLEQIAMPFGESGIDFKFPKFKEKKLQYDSSWRNLPRQLLDSAEIACDCASVDKTRPILNCIHITDKFIESCDNFRIFRIKNKMEEELDICVFAKCIRSIKEFKGICYVYKTTPGWIHLGSDRYIASIRTFEGEYPTEKIHEISNMKERYEEFEFPPGVLKSLERAEIFADFISVDEKMIKISLKENKMTVKGQNSHGWIEESFDCAYSGKPVSFSSSVDILKHALRSSVKTKIYQGDCLMLSFSGNIFLHVITVVR